MSSLVDFPIPPPPDLTPYIVKGGNQYLAGGSFGDVYRCCYNRDSNEKEVAVKAFRFKLPVPEGDGGDRSTVGMARRELGIWRRLEHENIVPFLGIAYGFGMCDAVALVSLWMPNGTLHDFLAKHEPTLSVACRLQLLLDIADGLHYLHTFHTSPIVHGDLNCNNILLDENYTARLADFGYASLVGSIPEALTYLQSTVGTGAVRWSAPEQLSSGETPTRTTKSDIYSFGCVALQVLSGKQPWSEIKADMCIIRHLAQGHNPRRPDSPAIHDQHWELIKRCWLPVTKRPPAKSVIASIQMLLRNPMVPIDDANGTLGLLHRDNRRSSLGSATLLPATKHANVLPKSIMAKDHFKPDPKDLIIIVMGPSRSGKTHFINTLCGNIEQREATSKPDTRRVIPHTISFHDQRLFLVEAPGFDDTHRPDTEILRMIANWLVQMYPDGNTIKIAGTIYLHRITDKYISGAVFKNLQMFGQLCGNMPLPRVRLVTTMWDKVRDTTVAKDRELHLKHDLWWKLIRGGAVAKRFQNTSASAWDIMDGLLGMEKERNKLLLQEQLINQQKRLNETEAAKFLYSRLQQLLAEQKKRLKELTDEAKLQNDPALAKSLQEKCDKISTQMQKTFEEVNKMKVPLSRRTRLWLFGRKSHGQAITWDHPKL